MVLLEKLNRKIGKYAIPGLMKYVVIVYAVGFIVHQINPYFYETWLMLDIDKLLHGQVWRLVTFLIQPIEDNFLFLAIMLYVYYSIGTTLERVWGTFFFNFYYFMGVIFNILAVVVIYLIMYFKYGFGYSFPVPLEYLNLSMLLAFALTFPEARFYLMFLIPFKAKYLIFLYLGLMAYTVYNAFSINIDAGICVLVAVLAAMANFLIYFLMSKKHLHPANIKRRMQFKQATRPDVQMGYSSTVDGGHKVITRHKCAVCGRTELDGENMQFRFCSKCNGNYEYCQDHLFTHTHIE
ncbi:MAG: hypothetical protein IK071_09770 [Lachnospiraceae bacterium]|nr:hypothetical protein [Lachnospiraceae bacterium]